MSSNLALMTSFIVYIIGIVALGVYSARFRKKTTEDFFLANRELGPVATALSASASSESGWVTLGLVGAAFSGGISVLWMIPGTIAGYLFNWLVIANRLRASTSKSGAVTLTQFICHRFDSSSISLRIISVLVISLTMLSYVAAQLTAAAKTFDAIFAIPYWIGVLMGALIILIYTTTGGFRASCWTDIIQASFMLLALLGMPIVILIKIGGFSALFEGLKTANLLSFSGGNVGFSLLGFIFGWAGIGLAYPGQPHVLVRFMGASDSKAINKGMPIAVIWSNLVFLGAILFGLGAHVYFGQLVDPELALPLASLKILPAVFAGFILAAIISAICSTADSQLLVLVSTIFQDGKQLLGLVNRNKLDNSNKIAMNQKTRDLSASVTSDRSHRFGVIFLGIIAVFFALTENRTIFTFVLYAWAVLGATFGPVVIMGLLWNRATKAGAIAGMITGAVVTVVWKNIPILSAAIYELVPAFILAFVAIILGSLFGKRDLRGKDIS